MSSSYIMLRFLRKNRAKMLLTTQCKKVDLDNKIHSDLPISTQCRICLKAGSVPIYRSDTPFDIQNAIRIFGDVEIHETDSYPKHLCDACQSLLNGAVLFRKLAKQSDSLLQFPTNDTKSEDDPVFSDNRTHESLHKCKSCDLEFGSIQEYLAHRSTKSHKNVRIQCSICNRLFTPQLYKNHAKRHKSESQLICEVCGKLFRKDNLLRHLQQHSYDLPFRCQECPYKGRFLESLKLHVRTHSGEKPFSCDKCELRFITKSNLNRHLLTHKKDKPYKCVDCSRGFHTNRDLDLHFKTDHSGIKDFGCKMCGNKYSTRKALMRHELRFHKRDKMSKGRTPLYLQPDYRNNEVNKSEQY